jgi:hypothetical protein
VNASLWLNLSIVRCFRNLLLTLSRLLFLGFYSPSSFLEVIQFGNYFKLVKGLFYSAQTWFWFRVLKLRNLSGVASVYNRNHNCLLRFLLNLLLFVFEQVRLFLRVAKREILRTLVLLCLWVNIELRCSLKPTTILNWFWSSWPSEPRSIVFWVYDSIDDLGLSFVVPRSDQPPNLVG